MEENKFIGGNLCSIILDGLFLLKQQIPGRGMINSLPHLPVDFFQSKGAQVKLRLVKSVFINLKTHFPR